MPLTLPEAAVVSFLIFAAFFIFTSSLYRYLNNPLADFPVNQEIIIEEGLTHAEITHLLKNQHVVRSSFFLSFILKHVHADSYIKAGVYVFDTPRTAHEVAQTLVNGELSTSMIRVTFPEGFSSRTLTDFLPQHITATNTQTFEDLEGYLFPDTYFISYGTTLAQLVDMMRTNFNYRLAPYESEIEASPLSLEEIITLASLVEREARDLESKRIVAGVLHNRLEVGMPLQVDAVFDYLLGKRSNELTEEDLALDSPYNTYLYPGLPPAPIANPGIEAIEAVLHPTSTDYFYYLTADDGTFHYAKTFAEHKQNKNLYLR